LSLIVTRAPESFAHYPHSIPHKYIVVPHAAENYAGGKHIDQGYVVDLILLHLQHVCNVCVTFGEFLVAIYLCIVFDPTVDITYHENVNPLTWCNCCDDCQGCVLSFRAFHTINSNLFQSRIRCKICVPRRTRNLDVVHAKIIIKNLTLRNNCCFTQPITNTFICFVDMLNVIPQDARLAVGFNKFSRSELLSNCMLEGNGGQSVWLVVQSAVIDETQPLDIVGCNLLCNVAGTVLYCSELTE
jgi:hypothetical protein